MIASRDVARITLVVAATALGLWALYQIRHVVLLVGIAAFLALALEPAVSFLQRKLKSRGLAVGTMITLLVLFIILFFALVGPPIFNQADNLIEAIPQLQEDIKDESTFLGGLERRFDILEKVEEGAGNVTKAVTNLPKIFGTVFGFVADFLVVLVLTLYFLLHAPEMKSEGIRLLPERKRKRTGEIAEVVFAKVGGWMEGNVLISGIAGVVSFIGLAIIGVPYAAALAMWVAIADLIPMVGAMLGAIVCVTVAFFDGTVTGVITAIFFLTYQQIENYVIVPRVMKKTVDVSAVSVIIAALVGATLLGPVGVLLAVPAAASLKVVANEIWLKKGASEPQVTAG